MPSLENHSFVTHNNITDLDLRFQPPKPRKLISIVKPPILWCKLKQIWPTSQITSLALRHPNIKCLNAFIHSTFELLQWPEHCTCVDSSSSPYNPILFSSNNPLLIFPTISCKTDLCGIWLSDAAASD